MLYEASPDRLRVRPIALPPRRNHYQAGFHDVACCRCHSSNKFCQNVACARAYPWASLNSGLAFGPSIYPLVLSALGDHDFGASARLLEPSIAALVTTGRPEAFTKNEMPILRSCSVCDPFNARPVSVISSNLVKNISIFTHFLLLGREWLPTFSKCYKLPDNSSRLL